MKVKIEKLEKNTVQLEITVDAATLEAGIEKSYIKNVKKFDVPGFRKGKAPRKMIEKMYGASVFLEDAIEEVVPDAYVKAIKENSIEPVDNPDYDLSKVESGEDLVFTAKVTVKPEVELGKYTKLDVEKEAVVVTDDEVEEDLNKVAERNARMITVEDRPVRDGDTAVIDFEGFIDDEPFEGGKGDNYSLVIGSGSFIPGFEEQLVGVEAGAEVDVKVTFPEDYGHENLAGKEAVFKCKVNEIKFKELPVIDDEFAKDVSEFDTLEEYKKDIREKIVKKKEDEAARAFENAVIEKIIDNSIIDLPEVMVDNRIDSILNDMDMRLRYQGMDLNTYAEYMGTNLEELKKQFEVRAEREVRGQLCLEKIGEVEGFDVTEEEVQTEIEKIADQYQQPVEEIKKQFRDIDYEYIKKDLIIRKTVDFIVANA